MNILDDLKFRGLLFQCSDEEALRKRLDDEPITLYVGFDPTADSLHVGNLLQILALKRFQLAGHHPIALAGGGTGLIGDPSGKSEERQLNAEETVEEWNEKIKTQLERFLDFDSNKNPARLVNNYDWLGQINYLEFLRDVGKHFNLNDMLDKESVKERLKVGISFTEFNYQILQAYDFMQLKENHGCELQVGGSDQWGNIIAGVELLRKKKNEHVFALTQPLVTKADGTKFGKTAGGAIWLDAEKTSPYEFYQFWYNTDDGQVIDLIKYFTLLPHDEINRLKSMVDKEPEKREAQHVLARSVTEFVHGQEAVSRAERISEILFGGDIAALSEQEIKEAFSGAPQTQIGSLDMPLVDLLVETGLCSSKRQAREDIENGAVSVNGVQATEDISLSKDHLRYDAYLILRRGKKKYHLVRV